MKLGVVISVIYHQLFCFNLTGIFVFRSSTSSIGFGPGTGAISPGYMNCDGSETSLQSCSRSSTSRYCSHDSDVGVWCDGIDNSGEGMKSYLKHYNVGATIKWSI